MHKKSSRKLRKIPCMSNRLKPIAANGFVFRVWTLAHVSNNPINIRYFEWVYRWKISISNLKMEFDSNNAFSSRLMKIIPKQEILKNLQAPRSLSAPSPSPFLK